MTGQSVCRCREEERSGASSTSLRHVVISKALVKRLLYIYSSRDTDLPGRKLSKDLRDLFEALASLLPTRNMPFSQSRLHCSSWFFCCVLSSKYSIISNMHDQVNEFQMDLFKMATDLLKSMCRKNAWFDYSWTTETYWLLFYFYELTKFKHFAQAFARSGGVEQVSRLLGGCLSCCRYSTDLANDEIIIVLIVKNVMEADVGSGYNERIIPVLLKYLKSMRGYIFVTASHVETQRMLLLAVLSIIFHLSTRLRPAYRQVLHYRGIKILGSFIGSHPTTDLFIYKYLLLMDKLKIILTKESAFREIKSKSSC